MAEAGDAVIGGDEDDVAVDGAVAEPAADGAAEVVLGHAGAGILTEDAADDVGGRISDFAFDIAEHHRVAPEVVRAVSALAHEHGARTHSSSVHLHITFDADDKATGVVRLINMLWGTDPTLARFRHAFIGDSENDGSCFAAFRTSIAVQNFSGRPTVGPRYLTRAARGQGFAEAAARLVALRGK